MPRKDPLVEEIHAVREKIAREADYDLEQVIQMARARQEASGLQGVRLPPRRKLQEEVQIGLDQADRGELLDGENVFLELQRRLKNKPP